MSKTSKVAIHVLIAVFLLVFGTYIAGTILTPFAESLGASWFMIGVLSSSMYCVRLIIGAPVGLLADRKGIVQVLKYSLALYPFIALAYAMSSNIPLLLGARLIHGVASAMMLPMAAAYMGQISPAGQEGRFMGIYNTVIFFASGLGPAAATIITDVWGMRSAYYSLFILALISLVLIILTPKNSCIEVNMATEKKFIPPSGRNLFGNRRLAALGSINVALGVIASLIGFFFIAYPAKKGISLVMTGLILATYNGVSGMVQFPLGKLADTYYKPGIIVAAGIVSTGALLLFPAADSGGLMLVLMIVTALGTAAVLTASSALSAVIGRETGMGGVMGFLGTANSLGMIFGGIILGLLPDHYGIESVFYAAGFINIFCVLLFIPLWNGRRTAMDIKIRN